MKVFEFFYGIGLVVIIAMTINNYCWQLRIRKLIKKRNQLLRQWDEEGGE
jgi:hypothetical protein